MRFPADEIFGAPAAVLALHGFTGCGGDFDALRLRFPDAFFDAPDLHSADVPADFRGLVAALVARFALLPAPAGAPRVLLGYSMGGRVALHVALEISRRKRWRAGDRLVLISASPGIADAAERAARRERDAALAAKILAAPSAAAFYETWRRTPLIATQDRMPEPRRSRLLRARAAADKTLWARALAELGTGALPPLWENLGEIDVETVLVCGAEDAKFSAVADAMRARLPRSRVVRVPACGHAPHLEAAD